MQSITPHTCVLPTAFLNLLSGLRTQLWAAMVVPLRDADAATLSRQCESDFEGWLRCDPCVIMTTGNHYGERSPGYVTGNGLGSLEVGAADD